MHSICSARLGARIEGCDGQGEKGRKGDSPRKSGHVEMSPESDDLTLSVVDLIFLFNFLLLLTLCITLDDAFDVLKNEKKPT